MSPERKKSSRGLARHIRREKASQRKVALPPPAEKTLEVREEDRGRERILLERLSSDSARPKENFEDAELFIELCWLQYKLNEIDDSERMSRMARFLNSATELVREYLGEDIRPGLTRLAQIRDRVIPPASFRRR